MNDDVKAAVEWLRTVVRAIRVDPDIPGDTHEVNLLAHLDGEAARTAAAVAVAAKPLADRIAELEWENRQLHKNADDYMNARDRAEKAEAERDEAMKDGRTVVEAADQMRQEWAEIEERLTAERDALADSLAWAAGATAEQAKALHEKLAIDIRTERDALKEEARAHAEKCIQTDIIAVENERDALRRELADLIPLAESAMRQANNDGGEYDIKAELADARRVAEANMQTAERASQSIDAVAAERDALRAQVDKLRTDLANADAAYAGDVSAQRVRAERAEAQVEELTELLRSAERQRGEYRRDFEAWRAKAEAARALCDVAIRTRGHGLGLALEVVAAMDGTKP